MYIYFTIRMLVLVILLCFFCLFIFGGGCFLFYWVFLLAYFLYFILSNTKQSFIVPTQDNLIDYLWYHYKEKDWQKLLALIIVHIHRIHTKSIFFSNDIKFISIFEIAKKEEERNGTNNWIINQIYNPLFKFTYVENENDFQFKKNLPYVSNLKTNEQKSLKGAWFRFWSKLMFPFLTHLNWKLKLTFLITICPTTVCLSVCL